MEAADEHILRHYEAIREEDRISRGFGQLELLRVKEVLSRHLPPPPAQILDVGGATGVHARWLAERGYSVRVVDISPRHVAVAKQTLGSLGVQAELGDARQLPVPDGEVDVALLFGPLYHLTERADRLQALVEAKRAVRPGGIVAVGAISRFASLFDGLAREFLFDDDFLTIAERDLAEGQHRSRSNLPHSFTTAFFHHPDELGAEVREASLQVLELVGVEGLAGWLSALAARWEDPHDRERILWSAKATEAEPSLIGLSAHLLLVALRQE